MQRRVNAGQCQRGTQRSSDGNTRMSIDLIGGEGAAFGIISRAQRIQRRRDQHRLWGMAWSCRPRNLAVSEHGLQRLLQLEFMDERARQPEVVKYPAQDPIAGGRDQQKDHEPESR